MGITYYRGVYEVIDIGGASGTEEDAAQSVANTLQDWNRISYWYSRHFDRNGPWYAYTPDDRDMLLSLGYSAPDRLNAQFYNPTPWEECPPLNPPENGSGDPVMQWYYNESPLVNRGTFLIPYSFEILMNQYVLMPEGFYHAHAVYSIEYGKIVDDGMPDDDDPDDDATASPVMFFFPVLTFLMASNAGTILRKRT